jgi:hypothetical protein
MNKTQLRPRKGAIKEATAAAHKAYEKYKSRAKITNHDFMVVINFREPSFRHRLYVINLDDLSVMRTHHTTHGVNSSNTQNRAYADKFSNRRGSHQSSLGAMVTAETYYGRHGYSLRLDGLEKQNSQVRGRYIVIHPAPYVTDPYILANGRAGQSHGCPAVDPAISRDLIDLIKEGTFLYAYY